MQRIANETNLSETTFIIRRDPTTERREDDAGGTSFRWPSNAGDGLHNSQLLCRIRRRK